MRWAPQRSHDETPHPASSLSHLLPPGEGKQIFGGALHPLVMVSLSLRRGCPARRAFISARGTGEGLLPTFHATLVPEPSNFDCFPRQSRGIS